MSLQVMSSSAFDYHDSQGPRDAAGDQPAPVFVDAESRNDCEEVPGSSSSVNAGPRRVPAFYMEPVVFQVENRLFKVPKNGFQVPGTIFEAMFALPSNETDDSIEGSSDENPIHLHGIEEKKFKAFLTVLYPSKALIDDENRYFILLGALDLATFWEFTQLRKDIISDLSPMIEKRSDLEVMYLGKKYRVASWLRMAYTKLVQICAKLPIETLISSQFPLDWETIAKLYQIRDTICREAMDNATCEQCHQTFGPSYGQRHEPRRFSCECRVVRFINTHFNGELEAMRDDPLSDFFTPPMEIPYGGPRAASAGSKKKKKK
ncbi:hypothetical protein HYPSUDRAFT_33024 [Hypholoma sublateritium FD-334 SS-4]|uniref:BTB domain-containing protein n=1 Tax=Hypholoma sublateritium (strain FD-334 SS-4) TaxID=945553 RepID=A0A0D2MXD1_HYPSF|nr:hypothetical protein HYPSUDRAFT_33024 [Hypholoma sublateritium FD-334 SS-4]